MSQPVITVEKLGKKYQLGERGGAGGYRRLSEELFEAVKKPFRRKSLPVKSAGSSEFWALDDVSFSVQEGEVVGVIGRNGAGKSTLLKILSRITDPSAGRVRLRGRVASLLEIGTGFHPELTGRENIFLNGAILGMTRAEIRKKLDEIVAFAEVEKFLDTPVKRYSSGMYVRLAFAVAAHLEPEILVVDEVLAVGDMAFQKKCLGKMGEIARGGRTVLFVSHNMGTVMSLCERAIWLHGGRIKLTGTSKEVVGRYTTEGSPRVAEAEVRPEQRVRGSGPARIERIGLFDLDEQSKCEFLIEEPIEVELAFRGAPDCRGTAWLCVNTAEGLTLASAFMRDNHAPIAMEGYGKIRVRLDGFGFLPGGYTITAGLFSQAGEIMDWCEHVISFEILRHRFDGQSYDHRLGMLSRQLAWRQSS
jgi:lipopolysaccharide transport system ATP-binding protein